MAAAAASAALGKPGINSIKVVAALTAMPQIAR